ncbi:MAG: PIN domain-containing protein [Candidatus Woesearchaeota archaeon]
MPHVYLVDTCIWNDFCQGRLGDKDFCELASGFFMKVLFRSDRILISDELAAELRQSPSRKDIESMLSILDALKILQGIPTDIEDILEARILHRQRNVPFVDALFCLQARRHSAIIVSRDKHFIKMGANTKKPEDVI